jgi:hypothetical protein
LSVVLRSASGERDSAPPAIPGHEVPGTAGRFMVVGICNTFSVQAHYADGAPSFLIIDALATTYKLYLPVIQR